MIAKFPEVENINYFAVDLALALNETRIFAKQHAIGTSAKTQMQIGRPSVPLELKVLGALRMICKGCAFDTIAELSGMSEQTMQRFFHVFWEKFVMHFKDLWIKFPKTAAEAARSMEDYKKLGFPGAAGSVDCTHIWWGNCPARLANLYTGKEKVPTRATD